MQPIIGYQTAKWKFITLYVCKTEVTLMSVLMRSFLKLILFFYVTLSLNS